MKKRILVVEDEVACSNAICWLLEDAGFAASVAVSVDEASVILAQSPPDAVLLDVYLGKEHGLELLPKLRELCPHVPVVVLTGAGYDHSMIHEATEKGATVYFSKDINTGDVVSLLQSLMDRGVAKSGT